jgi:uncharacterized protein YegP (UPF0339 family)
MPSYWSLCTDANSYGTGATSVDVQLKGGYPAGEGMIYEIYLECQDTDGSWYNFDVKKGTVYNDTGIMKFYLTYAKTGYYRLRLRYRNNTSVSTTMYNLYSSQFHISRSL